MEKVDRWKLPLTEVRRTGVREDFRVKTGSSAVGRLSAGHPLAILVELVSWHLPLSLELGGSVGWK